MARGGGPPADQCMVKVPDQAHSVRGAGLNLDRSPRAACLSTVCILMASVVDLDPHTDPYVFGPPGSGSGCGSGSFHHQAKIVR